MFIILLSWHEHVSWSSKRCYRPSLSHVHITFIYPTCTIHLSQNQSLPTASTFRSISCFHRNEIQSDHTVFFPIGSNLHQNLQCFFNPKSQQLSLELWLQTHSSLVNLPPPPQRTPLGSKGLIRRLVYGKLVVFIRVIS